jgi:hypothetical protein
MGNASGQLGLMDHHFLVAQKVVQKVLNKYTYGRRANGLYSRYQNVGNDKRDYLRGFGYQGGASSSIKSC